MTDKANEDHKRKRINYIKDILDTNIAKASLIDQIIKDIPDDKLSDFFIFRMEFVEQYKSAELITKEALAEYQRRIHRDRLKKGERLFSNTSTLLNHLKTFYKGRDIVNGPASYYDFVVIGMNREGELVNKYHLTEHSNYTRLNSDDTAEVLQWLLEHQDRIGDAQNVPVREVQSKLGPPPDQVESLEMSEKTQALIGSP